MMTFPLLAQRIKNQVKSNQGTPYWLLFFPGLPPFPGTKILSSLLSSRLIK
jgi:hypothetical protein